MIDVTRPPKLLAFDLYHIPRDSQRRPGQTLSDPQKTKSTMGRHSPFHCFSLVLLILPPLLLTAYFLAAFPNPPAPIVVHQSLASLPSTSKSWSIYPEDFYPGGAYAELPYGKVCTPHRKSYDSLCSHTFNFALSGSILVAGAKERQKGACFLTSILETP